MSWLAAGFALFIIYRKRVLKIPLRQTTHGAGGDSALAAGVPADRGARFRRGGHCDGDARCLRSGHRAPLTHHGRGAARGTALLLDRRAASRGGAARRSARRGRGDRGRLRHQRPTTARSHAQPPPRRSSPRLGTTTQRSSSSQRVGRHSDARASTCLWTRPQSSCYAALPAAYCWPSSGAKPASQATHPISRIPRYYTLYPGPRKDACRWFYSGELGSGSRP